MRRAAGDPRLIPLSDWEPLADVPVLDATVSGNRDDIDALRRELHPGLAECFDTVEQPQQTWLEIMSTRGTKAAAAHALGEHLHTDRLVAFSDVPPFEAAYRGYAVANAVPTLSNVADGVIPSDDDEGTAGWLQRSLFGTSSA